jgi:two-component system chemotaxis response regulator CheY
MISVENIVGEPVGRVAHVLIVEDDLQIRETVVSILEDAGHRCSSAGDGREALTLLAKASELPDLILLDLRMPVLDGAGFRAAQLADPRLAAIPTAILSANAQGREVARELGAAAYLRKPCSLDDLLNLVERFARRPREAGVGRAT